MGLIYWDRVEDEDNRQQINEEKKTVCQIVLNVWRKIEQDDSGGWAREAFSQGSLMERVRAETE